MPRATGIGYHFILVSARALRNRVPKDSLYSLLCRYNLAEEEKGRDLWALLACCNMYSGRIKLRRSGRSWGANIRGRAYLVLAILGSWMAYLIRINSLVSSSSASSCRTVLREAGNCACYG